MTPWTEERVRLLIKLSRPKKFTAQQIADRLSEHFHCRISRNAVIGKMRRLGISGRLVGRTLEALRQRARANTAARKDKAGKPPEPVRANGQRKPKQKRSLNPAIALDQQSLSSARDAIDALNPSDCRWPEGDPLSADFRFCGQMRRIGYPYCEHHLSRAARRPVAGGEQ